MSYFRFREVETDKILYSIDLEGCNIMPTIPCIGAYVKHRDFQGTVKAVTIDYTINDHSLADAVVIIMQVDKF